MIALIYRPAVLFMFGVMTKSISQIFLSSWNLFREMAITLFCVSLLWQCGNVENAATVTVDVLALVPWAV